MSKMLGLLIIAAAFMLATGPLVTPKLGISESIRIARGDYPIIDYVHKFGLSRSMPASNEENIWSCGDTDGGDRDYPWATLNPTPTLYISSSSAADNFPIEVEGVDANWEFQSQTTNLDGQTTVELGSGLTWNRVFRAKNMDPDGDSLAGDVYIHTDSDAGADGIPDSTANTVGCIAFGFGDEQTLMSLYTVPADYDAGYLDEVCVGVNRQTTAVVDFVMAVRQNGIAPGPFQTKFAFSAANTSGISCKVYDPPLRIPAKADVQVLGTSTAVNTTAYATFSIDLVR